MRSAVHSRIQSSAAINVAKKGKHVAGDKVQPECIGQECLLGVIVQRFLRLRAYDFALSCEAKTARAFFGRFTRIGRHSGRTVCDSVGTDLPAFTNALTRFSICVLAFLTAALKLGADVLHSGSAGTVM